MSDTFAARADAIFGVLGNQNKAKEWSLDTAQGFKPGADDALDRGSSDDEAEEPVPESLPGADDSDEEQTYRLRASKCYRQAFEREEEEDEYDRVAAGASAGESRPARSMEVLEDNMFDRMHSQSYHTADAQAAPANAAAADLQQPMDLDEQPPPLEPAAVQKQQQQQQQQQHLQQQGQLDSQQAKRQKPSRQTWVPPHRRPDHRPLNDAAEGNQQQHPGNHRQQQQHQGRRVRFADGSSTQQATRDVQNQPQQQQQGHAAASNRRVDNRRGRRGHSIVPDHVQNPHKYTVYTLDEPLYVGQGDKDPEEMRSMQRGGQIGNRGSSSSRRGESGWQRRGGVHSSSRGTAAAGGDLGDRGRWQGGQDEGPMLLEPSGTAEAANTERQETAVAEEPVRELPPTGAIKFQPTSKRAKTQDPAGTASDQVDAEGISLSRPPGSTMVTLEASKGAYMEEQMQVEKQLAPLSAAASASVTRSKGTRQRHYRTKGTEDDG